MDYTTQEESTIITTNNTTCNNTSDTIFQQVHNYYKKNYQANWERTDNDNNSISNNYNYDDTNPNRQTNIIDFHKVIYNSYYDAKDSTNLYYDDRIIRIEIPAGRNLENDRNSNNHLDDKDNRIDNTNTNINYYNGPWYGLKDFPGFMIAPSALSEQLQLILCYNFSFYYLLLRSYIKLF